MGSCGANCHEPRQCALSRVTRFLIEVDVEGVFLNAPVDDAGEVRLDKGNRP